LFTLEKFRSSVWWAAAKRVELASRREFVTESEVGNFDIHFAIQQQILCLFTKGQNKGYFFKFHLL
jgi:hypothetical protein